MLANAFNTLLRLHSRPTVLRRYSTVTANTYYEQNIRVTPSNYFRNLEGPSHTIIEGREFLIGKSLLQGWLIWQMNWFEAENGPTSGQFKLQGPFSEQTDFLDWDATPEEIRDAVRGFTGFEDAIVEGSINTTGSITVKYVNVPKTSDAGIQIVANTLDVSPTFMGMTGQYEPWSPLLKRGDKIIDSELGSLAIDEIIEVYDLGAVLMGWRIRCE